MFDLIRDYDLFSVWFNILVDSLDYFWIVIMAIIWVKIASIMKKN